MKLEQKAIKRVPTIILTTRFSVVTRNLSVVCEYSMIKWCLLCGRRVLCVRAARQRAGRRAGRRTGAGRVALHRAARRRRRRSKVRSPLCLRFVYHTRTLSQGEGDSAALYLPNTALICR